jgi:integrase
VKRLGGQLEDEDWVFSNWHGSLRPPRSVTKEWSDAMKRLGVKASFHSLRHTHASELLRAGVDVVNVSRRLGHGSAAITLRIYAHVLRPNDDHIAQIVETVLSGGDK